ncbi:hypothetical protein OG440_38815 (plasmid) [Streptomyces sp. NBC_00637]|jgi:hypothetical protein|uniref:hypothetical protein n=1 Tax=Streptomyces sp. NBC_00637 TaxID=2903667 RepID=UPI002F9166FD
MNLWTAAPDARRQAPTTLWAWADEFDRLAGNAVSVPAHRHPAPWRSASAAGCRQYSALYRTDALVGALMLDGLPVTWSSSGQIAAPHPLTLRVDEQSVRVLQDDGSLLMATALASGLDETVAGLYDGVASLLTVAGEEPNLCKACARWVAERILLAEKG